MSRSIRWPRTPILIKEHVVIDGLPVGALRVVFPDDADYDEHFVEFVRLKGAYPYCYATDEDITAERARRAERVSRSILSVQKAAMHRQGKVATYVGPF